MPDPKEPAVEESPKTAPPQEESPKEETTPPKEKDGTTETPKEEKVYEVTLANIKEVGGKVVYIDPDNPEKTLYQADSVQELMTKIIKGIAEKDKHIARLQSERISIPKRDGRKIEGEDEEETPEFPDPQEVLLDVAKKRGLDPAVFNWNKEKWREFEAAQGVGELIDLKSLKAAVEQETNAKVSAKNLEVMNLTNAREQEDQIRELCAKAEVPEGDIDWDEVLKPDPKDYYKSGILKSGVIVRRAAEEINRILKDQGKKTLKKEVTEEIADGERKKKEAASDGGSVSPATKLQRKAPKNIDEASERALAAFK